MSKKETICGIYETKNMQDVVLIESPIEIIVNSKPLVNIICLPNDLKELAIGFLFSIGIINTIRDIKEIKIDDLDNIVKVKLKENMSFNPSELNINPISRVVETICGISSPWRDIIKKTLYNAKEEIQVKKNIKLNSELIFTAIKEMQQKTSLFRETGGCHGAAIFDLKGKLLTIKEDIGRHNAIDKVIGDFIIKERSFDDIFLTSTGRLTGDSVLKAIRARIPILASLSAAIESGIRLAFAYEITLIGFVRGSRMNIYTHPQRIRI